MEKSLALAFWEKLAGKWVVIVRSEDRPSRCSGLAVFTFLETCAVTPRRGERADSVMDAQLTDHQQMDFKAVPSLCIHNLSYTDA